jgi:CrcB protein
MSMGRALAAVAVGGSVGTGIRLGLDLMISHDADSFPVSTLIVNTLGAFVLGVLVARLWPVAPSWLRAGLGAGLLGSFTTFSAVAVSLVSLGAAGAWMLALGYLAATLILGLTAAWLGLRTGRPAEAFDEVDE